MQPLVAEADLRAELLTPVPIAGRRQRERGYNQAGLLARDLGALSGLPVIDALTRRRFDGPQAGAATADQRWRRVQGSFAVRRPEAVRGRRVLLVDDVATTGATLDACARELLAAGAESVSAITFGRED